MYQAVPTFLPLELTGDCTFRGVAITLPTQVVRNLLPFGLDLGPQSLTPAGTHPVAINFNELFRVHMNVPTLLPNMTYHEVLLGVPYVYVTQGQPFAPPTGPFLYMPKLYLDNLWAIAGGVLLWGFDKVTAEMALTDRLYTVRGPGNGGLIASLEYEPCGDWQPARAASAFDALRLIMSQPLVLQQPFGVGPFLALSNFDKDWDAARVRPLRTALRLEREIVAGLPCGRFPDETMGPGFDAAPLGGFEASAPWRLTSLRPWWIPGGPAPMSKRS